MKCLLLLAPLSLLVAASPASARPDEDDAPMLTVYDVTKDTLLVGLGDNRGSSLHDKVGTKGKGPVRCFTAADKFRGGEIGCFVGIKHDGTLTAPPAGSGKLEMLAPVLSDRLTIEPGTSGLKLSAEGAASAAIALWAGATDGKKGALRFEKDPDTEMNTPSSTFHVAMTFTVVDGGVVKAAK